MKMVMSWKIPGKWYLDLGYNCSNIIGTRICGLWYGRQSTGLYWSLVYTVGVQVVAVAMAHSHPPSTTSKSATDTTAPLRILCLHDENSTAADLYEQFDLLGKKLYENHAIDLVYVNSPIAITSTESKLIDPSPLPETQRIQDLEKRNEQEPMSIKVSLKDIDDNIKVKTVIRRVWWEEIESFEHESFHVDEIVSAAALGEDQPSNSQRAPTGSSHSIQYRGLDASLMLIRQIWTASPFWGILGVGQGAAVAALFLALLERDSETAATRTADAIDSHRIIPNTNEFALLPQFAIFVSGQSLIPVDEPLLDNHLDFPVLHVIDDMDDGNDDTASLQKQQNRLVRQFPNGLIKKRNKPRDVHRTIFRFDSHDLNHIGRFIVDQKKDLFCDFNCHSTAKSDIQNIDGDLSSLVLSSSSDISSTRREILSLQSALHNAEQDAALCIAETIALLPNPPAALMAVIRPQGAVAGWQGNRRRQPKDEGGGAPCPSEFLLHRQERNATGTSGNDTATDTSRTTDVSSSGCASRIHPKSRSHAEMPSNGIGSAL